MQKKLSFWIDIIEKLNTDIELEQLLPVVFTELCGYFEFGCAFLYRADESGIFHLNNYSAAYENPDLPPIVDIDVAMKPDMVAELSERSLVVYTGDADEPELEQIMKDIFSCEMLIIVPVTDQTGLLVAFVGLFDRRSKVRFNEEGVRLSKVVLGAVANRVKLTIYHEGIKRAQKSLEAILDNIGIDIYVNDFYTMEVLYANRSMAAPYGGVGNLIGKKCWQALYTDKKGQCEYCPQKKLVDDEGNPTKIYSWDYQRPFDKSWFRVISVAFPWIDGRLAHAVSSVDITDNKRNEEIIRKMAEHDTLTELPNRRKLIKTLEMLSYEIEVGAVKKIYLIFFDLNEFKAVNDNYGHNEGDRLLKCVGVALQENELTRNRAYRYGGDEFIVILTDPDDEQLRSVVAFLQKDITDSYPKRASGSDAIASVGIAVYPDDGVGIQDLIHNADLAMYRSKRSKALQVYFYNSGDICSSEDFFNSNPIKQ